MVRRNHDGPYSQCGERATGPGLNHHPNLGGCHGLYHYLPKAEEPRGLYYNPKGNHGLYHHPKVRGGGALVTETFTGQRPDTDCTTYPRREHTQPTVPPERCTRAIPPPSGGGGAHSWAIPPPRRGDTHTSRTTPVRGCGPPGTPHRPEKKGGRSPPTPQGPPRTHVVVVVSGGGAAQDLLVALAKGLQPPLQPPQLPQHLHQLGRRGVAAGGGGAGSG